MSDCGYSASAGCLINASFEPATNGIPFPAIRGRFVEVRLAMIRDDPSKQPLLYDLTLYGESAGFVGDYVLEPASVYETDDAWFWTDLTGADPVTYQWSVLRPWSSQWEALAGETNSYLRVPAVDLWDDGTYASLSITNGAGETAFLGPSVLSVYPLPIRIPGSPTNSMGPAERYPATVNVRGEPTNGLWYVLVTLHGLRHAYPSDLDILLVSPSGAKIMLMSSGGGGIAFSNATLVFHPTWQGFPAPPQQGPIPSNQTSDYSCSSYSGVETLPGAPDGPYLTDLNYLQTSDPNPNRLWRLYIYDHASGHTGVLQDSWSLGLFY